MLGPYNDRGTSMGRCWCKPRVDEGVAVPDCVVDDVRAETEWADGAPIDAGAVAHRVHVVADCEARFLDGATPDERGRDFRSVRFVCVSDTRGQHAQLRMPDDPDLVLLHCGNYTSTSLSTAASRRAFNDWLGRLPYRAKIVVPGSRDSPHSLSQATHFLCGDSVVDVLGVKIFGVPHHPSSCFLMRDTFGAQREARRSIYESVDLAGVHVFATHAPPFGVRDFETGRGHMGCAEQLQALRRLHPRAHVHGRSRMNRGVSRFWHSLDKCDQGENAEEEKCNLNSDHNGVERVSDLLSDSMSFPPHSFRDDPLVPSSVDASELDVELELGAMEESSNSLSASSGPLGKTKSYRMRRRSSNTAVGTLIVNAASTGNVDAEKHGGVAPPIILEVVLHRRKKKV